MNETVTALARPALAPRCGTRTAERDDTTAVAGQTMPDFGERSPGDRAGWELVEAAGRGDREAFGRLYEQHVGLVFGVVLARVGDRPLAEDITAETFLRALRGIPTVSYRGRSIRAWLVTIARNLILDHVKSSRYRFESVAADVPDPVVVAGGPEDEVIGRATLAEVVCAVGALGGAQQECVVLRFLQGLSVTETAVVMGRTPAAIKGLQHRAVRRLAQRLCASGDLGGGRL